MPFVPDWNDGSLWNQSGAVWGPAANSHTGGTMQNLFSYQLTEAKVASVLTKINALEQEMDFLMDLTVTHRKELTKMGPKSEAFCRQTAVVLAENGPSLPATYQLHLLQDDIASIDLVRPLFTRLNQLMEKAGDTEMAIGSDIMAGALEGYGVLKVTGKGAGLDDLRAQMSARFNKKPAAKKPATTTTPTPPIP